METRRRVLEEVQKIGMGGLFTNSKALKRIDFKVSEGDTFPLLLDFSEDLGGNPLRMKRFIVFTDMKAEGTYTEISINGINPHCYTTPKSMDGVYFEFGDGMYFNSRAHNADKPYCCIDGEKTVSGWIAKSVEEVNRIGCTFASGTYFRVYEIVDK